MTRTALAMPDDPDDRDPEVDGVSAFKDPTHIEPWMEPYFERYLTLAARTVTCRCDKRIQVLRFPHSDQVRFPHSDQVSDRIIDVSWVPAIEGTAEPKLFYQHQVKGFRSAASKPSWYSRISPQKLTGIAVFIAGRRRAPVSCEWRSHLSGETGSGLAPDRQVREAAGFLCAAVRYRLQDAADFTWGPVDTVLASRGLSNLFVLLATLSVSVLFIRQGGLNGLADNLGSVAVAWGAAFGLIHVGRQWRDVKPPDRKPHWNRQ